jgi:Family of unknown function (DUF6056)
MTFSSSRKAPTVFLNIALGAGTGAALIALGIFAYLGTYTRYLADDYCDTVNITVKPVFDALLTRYLTISDRYSNLLFTALSEFIAPRQIQVLPVVMLLLWTVAFIWLVHESKQLARLRLPFLADLFLGALLSFFPIYEAPNLFQTVYWRSAMATHFAPLVYLTAFGAFLLFQIRRSAGKRPSVLLGMLCLIIAFFGGGFSEPPDAMLIVASLFALVSVWLWNHGLLRLSALTLLTWTLGGGLLALAVMVFSPANAFRLGSPPPGIPILIYRTILYTLQFILDSFATLPLPTLVSIAIPAFLFYGLFAAVPTLSSGQKRLLLIIMAAAPVLMYIMIAASFAPSVYGQSYPIERARFAGRLMMTTASLLEGACLGVLFAQWKRAGLQTIFVNLALALLAVSAVYPLRAGLTFLQANLPEYRQWTSAWDARQKQIYLDKAKGQQDLVVAQLPGFQFVKELDARPHFWVNRCAATFYGVSSIRTVRVGPK